MPILPIRLANMLGGISRVAQSLRAPNEFENMVNVELSVLRGAEKRPGTEFIQAEGTDGELAVNDPASTKHVFWLNRASDERFVVLVDPDATDQDKVIQVFDLEGTEYDVEGDGNEDGTSNVLSNAENDDLRSYLANGTQDIRRRIRSLPVEDATFLLNRTVSAALKGSAITYRNAAGTSTVRSQSYAQNVAAWSEFEQPPSSTSAYPSEATLEAGGNIDSDSIWYARDDDVGQPQGFYWATSGTQPPWYQRLPTEPANSLVDETTMPLRLDFDPGATPPFVLKPVDWTHRYSGDGTTNPGPSFIGNAVSDIAFHQDRLFFLSGENIFGSRTGDVFNLWIDSIIQTVDSDPIDQSLLGNRTAIIDFAVPFQDSLLMFTRGARQVELRANGALTPSSAFLSNTTNLFSVDSARPASMNSQVYFLSERDFSVVVNEYIYDPNAFSNSAEEITERVQGLIPAEASLLVASEAHQQLFVLTDAETNAVYVYRTDFNQQRERTLASWYKWEFDEGNEILSINPFDNFLYMLIRRDDLVWLERIPLGVPQQDTDDVSGPLQGLGYSIPIDRKTAVAGSYDANTDTTTWTLPYEDATIDTLVLGPAWDQDSGGDEQRLAGARLDIEVEVTGGDTVITAAGQFEDNLLGDDALAFAGRSFTMDIELSEVFVRDQSGEPVQGRLQLMELLVRHRDTGFYSVEVIPPKRSTQVHEFVVPFIGSTDLDSEILDEFGTFKSRVFSASDGVEIHIKNDSPLPSAIIDLQFRGEFVPFNKPPV